MVDFVISHRVAEPTQPKFLFIVIFIHFERWSVLSYARFRRFEHTIRDSKIIREFREGENIGEYGNWREEKDRKSWWNCVGQCECLWTHPPPLISSRSDFFSFTIFRFRANLPILVLSYVKNRFFLIIIQSIQASYHSAIKTSTPSSTNETLPLLGAARYANRLLLGTLRSRFPRFTWRLVRSIENGRSFEKLTT